ncbi:MAG: WGR domain-containing protein [Myxococcota bacterium]
MAKPVIEWTRVGPERPERMVLPPVPMRLNGYLLDFDETIGEVVFVTGAGYNGFGELWSWNGARWHQHHEEKLNLDGEGVHHGYYDPSRKGVVAFRFGHDYETESYRPSAMLITSSGTSELTMTGELPLGPDGFNDVRGAFGYDRARDLGVCFTSRGVWELDRNGAWSKACDLTADDVSQEWKEACGTVWDPVRKKMVLWVYESDEYTHEFYEWDGSRLSRLPTTGLPMEEEGLRAFHIGLFNPSANLSGHPIHGLVLLDGAHFWRFDGSTWSPLPQANATPPRMQQGRLAYDSTRDRLVLGPGYHEGDGGGRDMQQTFYELHEGSLSVLGTKMEDCPVEDLYGQHLYFTCGGHSYVVTIRGLQTYGWVNDEWSEIVSEEVGDELVGDSRVGNVLGMGDYALAILQNGNVCRFDGTKWERTKESISDFKERDDFTIARRGDGEGLVVWGGEVKNRKSNDSFFRFASGEWRKHKKASPRPKDFGHKHGPYVDFVSLYDSSLNTAVRLGWDECFTLEGEVWKAWEPTGYKKLAGSRASEHLPVHDPETGETLLINLTHSRILRFDLKTCVEVARLALPHGDFAVDDDHERATISKLSGDLWYEPETRRLRALFKEDKWAQYAWDLSPAFEAAAKLGTRFVPASLGEREAKPAVVDAASKASPKASSKASSKASKKASSKATKATREETSARLYFIDDSSAKLWYCTAEGKFVVRRWGRIDGKLSSKRETKASSDAAHAAAAKLIAKKRDAGYVDATKLKLDAIASLATMESSAIKVGKATKRAPADAATSRIGGLPSGVGAKEWPKKRRKPMGFLLQVSGEGILKKHGGVAVFCTTDGSATEDESHNAALLITKAKWKKKPIAAPSGVDPLRTRKLTFGKPKLEIVEERVQELAKDDPELGARFDELQGSRKVHDEVPWSKRGGPPAWVQDGELGDDWLLLAQIDFDVISLREEWEDAGLFGVVYVVVRKDEQKAAAFWQYT